MNEPLSILHFWFEEIDARRWWIKEPAFDQEIEQRFGDLHKQAARCECFGWRATSAGRLAEILLLDQFSRNMFRGRPESFAQDPLALALAQEAVASGADLDLLPTQRVFLYMPFMHSESLTIHDEAVRLFTDLGMESNLRYEIRHREIIEQFGRYPHRNEILGRESTPEEVAFLAQPGSGF